MPTFNAADIIGKTLIAKTNVPLRRLPNDYAPEIYNVASGGVVGVVDTYLLPSSARSNIFWGFKDSNNRVYYAEHKVGRFDVKDLQNQGALTTEEKKDALEQASMTTGDKIFKLVRNVFIGAALIYLAKTIIDKKL
jgi:hypothetical protein